METVVGKIILANTQIVNGLMFPVVHVKGVTSEPSLSLLSAQPEWKRKRMAVIGVEIMVEISDGTSRQGPSMTPGNRTPGAIRSRVTPVLRPPRWYDTVAKVINRDAALTSVVVESTGLSAKVTERVVEEVGDTKNNVYVSEM